MIKHFKYIAAAGLLACTAVPAIAQDEPEEPRTTYRVVLLELNPGAGDRWNEIMTENWIPALKTAGQPVPEVHWIMAGSDYDIMMITEMPGGMATLDTHGRPGGPEIEAAIVEQLGSEEAAEALREEVDGLTGKSHVAYTHTHP